MIPDCNFTLLVHNRPALTQQTLSSLYRAGDLKHLRVTILVHDSDTRTKQIVERMQSWLNADIHYLDGPSNIGRNRNLVIDLASKRGREKYLYISDNDVFFKAKWWPTLVAAFEQAYPRGYRAIGAYNHPFHQHGEQVGLVREVQSLSHQSMLIRWEDWDKFGPCIETPEQLACQSEDVEYSARIKAAGYKVGTLWPPQLYNTGITNSYGQEIVGADLVRRESQYHPEVELE